MRTWIAIGPALLVAACSAAPEDSELTGTTGEALSATDPVSLAVSQSCTTTSVKGLSEQIVDEMNCMKPGSFDHIDNIAKTSLGSAVFPFLQTPAKKALVAAINARGTTMTINSAFRTVAQQYLLYAWYQQGRCGIGLAAIPGNSNHEQGLAVDIDDNGGWNSYMTKQGFQWFGNADPVHFDYVGGGAVNQKGFDVEAFQRLWNRNHANDTIAVDGSYGPETEKRLVQSPIGGFKIGAICNMMPPPDAGTDSGSPKPDSGSMNPPSPDAGAMPSTPDPMQTNDPGPQQQQPPANGCSSAPGSPSPSMAGALFVLLLLARRKR